MKTHYMKVREKFIPAIRNGNKKHEYRLANDKMRKIKVADTIVLISNQNKKNFVKVTIKKIKFYDGWKQALLENWVEFADLYTSIDDALKECHRFYSKDDVDKFGIVVFEIEELKAKCDISSVLLDTNIVIKRESWNNVSFVVTQLFNWFSKESIHTYIHPKTKEELLEYKDEKVKSVLQTKLKAYSILSYPSNEYDEHFSNVVSNYSQDKNDITDKNLLNEVYNYNVDILLTDDFKMLKKAEELFIRDRVLSSDELLTKFENKYPEKIKYKMLNVKLKKFSEVDLNSNFFDSLREDYEGKKFDDWFKKKANNGEKSYVFEGTSGLQGFLYLKTEGKDEKYEDIVPKPSSKKRLKVGTFKIESSGIRLGERFIKIIIDNACHNKVDEIYITLFEDKREEVKKLKELFEEWGFEKNGTKLNGEIVLFKTLESYNNSKDPKYNFPLIKKDAKHYFLPIFPQYHTDLFPDMILNNEDMHLYEENKAHRYAIEKIYLSGAIKVMAQKGDLVLIYRTGERLPKKFSSVVTGIAIIEDIIQTKNVEECIELCKNRSIFSEDEIRKKYKKYHLIIKLLDFVPFKKKITLNELYKNGIIEEKHGPRPFNMITKEQYEKIYKIGMEESK